MQLERITRHELRRGAPTTEAIPLISHRHETGSASHAQSAAVDGQAQQLAGLLVDEQSRLQVNSGRGNRGNRWRSRFGGALALLIARFAGSTPCGHEQIEDL